MNARQFQIIRSNSFLVSVAKKYRVIKHDIYKMQKKFFDSPIGQRVKPFALIDQFKGLISYEVRLDRHCLFFSTECGDRTPEDLKSLLEDEGRSTVELHDYKVGAINGKMVGGYSHAFSRIIWWLKAGDCLIWFDFHGIGEPSDEIKRDVRQIVESIEYSPKEST
jgi:hypothetical protein